MTAESNIVSAEVVLGGLKDFQKRTAEYAFQRLFKAADSTRRFLIADEVGLGKTLVAGGVIGLAVEHLRALDIPRVDVIYICSNQAIARQNVNRIKHLLGIETEPLASRITLLPYRLKTLESPVNLIALTPGTSFNSASAEGVIEERIILYRMLRHAWGASVGVRRNVFLGGLQSVDRFRDYERWIPERQIDAGIMQRFAGAVGDIGSNLQQEFLDLSDALARNRTGETLAHRRRFVSGLRRLLANACLDAMEPDLVILDEFQRFRELLNPDTESGELAQRLFEYEDSHTKVRTMLLSATPYKMYTVSHEVDDDHYRDFLNTVEFLQGPTGSVEPLEESLRQFRSELPRVAGEGGFGVEATNRLSGHRNRIQKELSRVMSRTERRSADMVGDPMLAAMDLPVELDSDDVEAYLSARDIAAAAGAPGIMEYWKSTPYLLSFMEQYRLADRVRISVVNEPSGEVAELVRSGAGLQLPRQFTAHRLEVNGGNGRMRAVLGDLRDSGLQGLLWLPPLLAGHELGPDFVRARAATKRLVFSSWTMVPRAISVLASYDAERRYIPDQARAEQYVPRGLDATRTGYALFSFLVPTAALAEAGDPYRHPHGDTPQLLDAIAERLRPQIEALTRDAPTAGQPQNIWYAVAPLLLDGASRDSIRWLREFPGNARRAGDTDDAEHSVWRDLVANVEDRLAESLATPSALGRPPEDLVERLAMLALSSPANASLRALSRISGAPATGGDLKREALKAAWAFRSLFRSPTSEGLLRNVYTPSVPTGSGAYLQLALAYSAEGGLSAVLDEFFHVVREANGGESGASDLVASLCETLQLATGRLDVVEWDAGDMGVQRRPYPMRQHFARRYANDRTIGYDPQAGEHVDAVRGAFYSPFWPFVLATTSVGQEGLDFHWYCHAVVHWNLPSNPVDLEQREGRVHRYHGHVIRKNIAQALGGRVSEQARAAITGGEFANPWDLAYGSADHEFGGDGGRIPHWVFPEGDARIQRYSPVLPLSRDAARIDSLRQALTVYRMVFGQPRQDDLLDFILREVPEDRRQDLAAALIIDLSPPKQDTC